MQNPMQFGLEISQIVEVWPKLPGAIRAGILAMVKAVTGGAGVVRFLKLELKFLSNIQH